MLFDLRRDLAVQVLSLLETLVSPESEWLWIAWHLDISTFSVTRTGQVSNLDGKGQKDAFKGGSLYFGAAHPCRKKPRGAATSGGERALQPQLFHGVETRGANQPIRHLINISKVMMATSRGQPGKGCVEARQYADLAFSLACRWIKSLSV